MASQGTVERVRPGAEHSVGVTVRVAAPLEAVWELLNDPGRFAEWADGTLEVTRADRPLGIGSSYEARVRVLGPMTGPVRWTVVEHEPPRRATHRGAGIAPAAAIDFFCELAPAGEGITDATLGLRYRPAFGPLGALLDSMVFRRRLRRSMERSAGNLAQLAGR